MTLSCAEARTLASELIDGELDDETTAAVLEHVATCVSCPPLYRAMVLVHDQLSRLRTMESEREQAALARVRSAVLDNS